MRIGDMPPSLPGRDFNPRTRDDQASNQFFSNSDKMHLATSDDAGTQAWFDYSRSSIFTQSEEKNRWRRWVVQRTNLPSYFHSVITLQHWCSLLQVISVKYREKDLQVHFLSEESLSLLILFTQWKQCLWTCSVCRKVRWKNPSLRPSEHGGSTGRTFIVEDYSEDEYRQWAHRWSNWARLRWWRKTVFFGHETAPEYVWQCRPFKGRQLKRRKGKGKAKEDSEEKAEHSLVKNKHTIMSGSLKKILPGGPKEDEARKVHRKVEIAFLKKVQGGDLQTDTKAKARNGKEKARKVLILNLFFFLNLRSTKWRKE